MAQYYALSSAIGAAYGESTGIYRAKTGLSDKNFITELRVNTFSISPITVLFDDS